jgi:hypothetical protein
MLKPSDCPDYQQFQDIFISEIIQESKDLLIAKSLSKLKIH